MNGIVVVVGGANLDIKGRLRDETALHTSNPGTVWRTFGGVGRNIAENLAVLGCPVRLVAPVGDDAAGQEVLRHLQDVGVDVEHVFPVEGERTGTYLAVMDRSGEMEIAVADMAIMDHLSPVELTSRRCAFGDAKVVCLDANLPADVLSLALDAARDESPRAVTVADPVSVPKALRLLPCLSRLDVITPSRDELAALSDMPVATLEDVARAARALRARGVQTVICTLGEQGVHVDTAAWTGLVPARSVEVVDVTGAGDAFTAGIIYGIYTKMAWAEAVDYAQGLAAQMVASTASVLKRASDPVHAVSDRRGKGDKQ
ncbi:carbohydrate kinase family protein [Alicyclobacillus cycloheptanicus]|uniref:Pseudouridine kinase n=1 Tax=Alicyclobacillus cycloheptanicus TaxID=1457 RepID=A0ABT9XKP3_9BACL|nr:carbohydrate kinase family protein [Alicyclobacillus cycloheptanicus]MDQ0190700.1 pseudouridine kinase [Alicyclobacillus cycloheptanicus]WDM00286.1 carbohydrate kinase family protein [Alicyclobacillus cycloheptanicus]